MICIIVCLQISLSIVWRLEHSTGNFERNFFLQFVKQEAQVKLWITLATGVIKSVLQILFEFVADWKLLVTSYPEHLGGESKRWWFEI